MSVQTTSQQTDDLIAHLLNLHGRIEQDSSARAALAELRRAATEDPRYDHRALAFVGRFVPPDGSDWHVDAHLLTATLFAQYAQGQLPPLPDATRLPRLGRRTPTLGMSARLLRETLERENKGAESLNRRFTALLDAPAEDLSVRLRRLVALLRSYSAPIRFDQLLEDLCNWKRHQRHVARAWAEDYWRALPDDSEDA
jgi:CRISPR system Cascade subunit CasB